MIELTVTTKSGVKPVKFHRRSEAQEHIDREYGFGRITQKEWGLQFDILSIVDADGNFYNERRIN